MAGIGFIIYLVRATRQYGRWLRDNYADLEHKEVWQSFVLQAVIILVFILYALEPQATIYKYITQLNAIILVFYLVWRVETLSDLNIQNVEDFGEGLKDEGGDLGGGLKVEGGGRIPKGQELFSFNPPPSTLHQNLHQNLQQNLQQHCIDTQLYLQHDLTLAQLAKTIGTNRTYLSAYFIQEGITYNAYINDLRIQHFVRLYREAIATQRSFTAQQLAHESGYRSYSTFSLAFKQRMGLTVTTWMRDKVS